MMYLSLLLSEFLKIASSHDWWDTMTCGQQSEYLKIHPQSDLTPNCDPGPEDRPSPLSFKQINQIQAEAMRRYHALRSRELGYDPGHEIDLEWVRLHAKHFRDLLRQHNLSK